jgi:lipopolysaccharide transport system ATP-binding protein
MDKTSEPVISLKDVTKQYTVWKDPSDRLLGALKRRWGAHGGNGELFTAVNRVSLEVMPGECLGIIGRNGAGKSTLLQIIAGTLRPSTGKIRVRGRVAALLELGSGFNPDFTGRENVWLNAAILGLSREEIARKFDAIAAYSGLEEFIDRPVRTYSTGMTVRLAFAVCVHVEADVVIIDEALAVGDARFQFKCHTTLEQMLREGRTIIFVSHDTNAVKRLCNSALLLERGEMLVKGVPNDVVNLYTKLITSPHGLEAIRDDVAALAVGRSSGSQPPFWQRPDGAGSPGTAAAPPAPASPATQAAAAIDTTIGRAGGAGSELLLDERAHRQVSDKEYAYGGTMGSISSVVMTDEGDAPRLSFLTGSHARVRIVCEATADIPDPIYALTLKDVHGQEIYGTNTYFQNQTPPRVPAGARVEVVFDLALNILPGVYFVSLGWVRLVNAEVVVIHRRYDVLRFDVMPCDKSFGIAYCPTGIQVRPVGEVEK